MSATWGARMRDAVTRLFAVAAVLLLVTSAAVAAGSQHSKLSPELQALLAAGDKKVDVIIQFVGVPTNQHFQQVVNAGGTLKRQLNAIHGGHFTVPVHALAGLANNPQIAYISLDRTLKFSSTTSTDPTLYPAQAVDADIAWASGFNGNGVGIAVIDSGISDNLDLHVPNGASRVVYNQSFLLNDGTTNDAYGHGTHVAGILGGNAANANYNARYSGIAPAVNLINLRVLDATGAGTDSSVIAAIQQAINLQSQYNIRVINLSLGRGIFESYQLDPLCQAVEQAWKSGIFVVVAAGNNGRDNSMGTNGYGTINSPGIDPYVITVGATKTDALTQRTLDDIASYSSKGPTLIDHIVKPDIVAPGNQIVSLFDPGSTLAVNYPQYDVTASTQTDSTPDYFRLSGTSMATPAVAGAAALLFQQHPDLTPDQMKGRLMKTAWKGFVQYSRSLARDGSVFSNQYDIFTYGAGYLDIWAALQNNDLGQGSALSPTAYFNPSNNTVSIGTSQANSILWGSSVLWGASVVWGANTFIDGNSVLWGSSVVWGANNSVLWGSTIVWGSSNMQALSESEDGEDYVDPATGTSL